MSNSSVPELERSPGWEPPRTYTNEELRARGREYQCCESCGISTEGGCIRNVRVDLLTARGGMLQNVEMLDYFFCSKRCCEVVAQMMIDEINDPSGIETIKDLYGHLKGHVARFQVWSTKVGPASGGSGGGPGEI